MAEDYLRSMLAGESRAYGFTIAFWGSGALLINEFGAPDITLALSYGFGAVLGFGLLALATFRSRNAESSDQALLVLSTMHYLSALMPMVFTHLAIQQGLSTELTFLIAGMSVSVLYNLLAVIEEDVARIVNRFV